MACHCFVLPPLVVRHTAQHDLKPCTLLFQTSAEIGGIASMHAYFIKRLPGLKLE